MSPLDPVQVAALKFAEGKPGVGNDNENSVPVYTCEYCGEQVVILLDVGFTEADLNWKCLKCGVSNRIEDFDA